MELIQRIPDPADLRSASVVSTAEGKRIDQQIKARRAAAVSECLRLLTAGQVASLTEALPALEALADVMQGLAAPQQDRSAQDPA
jgi:DNA-binding MarR family transcriptional regulator